MDINLTPLVSVIIPTYSRPNNLLRAIRSVRSQTYSNIEIIVVDDNGVGTHWQQETEKVLYGEIKKGTISYIKHDHNKNGSAARNTGLNLSNGKYVNFLDDDDEFSENRIEKCVEMLENNCDISGVFTDTVFKDSKCEKQYINPDSTELPAQELLLGKMMFNTSALFFRSNAIKSIGGFDESFTRHQDYELTIRFCEKYKIAKANGCYIIKHTSENIISKNPLKQLEYLDYFIDKMKPIIKSWPRGNEVIKHRYEIVSRDMFDLGYCIHGMKYAAKGLQYGLPSFRVLTRYIYHCLKSMVTFNLKLQ